MHAIKILITPTPTKSTLRNPMVSMVLFCDEWLPSNHMVLWLQDLDPSNALTNIVIINLTTPTPTKLTPRNSLVLLDFLCHLWLPSNHMATMAKGFLTP